MVPTAKPIADSHRQAIAHAGRTKKTEANLEIGFRPKKDLFKLKALLFGVPA